MSAINLSELFNQKIFRIPDYQRGYAWEDKQLTELWDDLEDINEIDGELKKHYTGTIYLEETVSNPSEKWLTGVKFYNIVDGQQRLTSISILLFELINNCSIGYCEESKIDLIKNFIVKSNASGESKVYKFSYSNSDKNYEFLLHKIFEDQSIVLKDNSVNLYIRNLENAKTFFKNRIILMEEVDKELLFKKIITSLQFDVRTIEKDLDVQAVFETMNNRGKPLSTLEKLKNRLIYLTEKLNSPREDKDNLRKKINDAWGKIYVSLAKNPDIILDEDVFLSAHLSLYRKPSEAVFSEKLAEEKVFEMFCNRSEKYDLDASGKKEKPVDYKKIDDYILKLSELAPKWYEVHNSNSKIIKKILLLNSGKDIKILIAALLMADIKQDLLNEFLYNLEKILFRNRVPGIWVMDERNSATWARDIYNKEETIEDINIKNIQLINTSVNAENIVQAFRSLYTYERGSKGFYRWNIIKYFLFEFEDYLKVKYRETDDKVTLIDFDLTTIEHIIPQKYVDNWVAFINRYSRGLNPDKTAMSIKVLINTLGNLTILKNGKNISLGNKGWKDKKDRFITGSYNEIDISKSVNWEHLDISKRGFEMLEFLQTKVTGLNFTEEEKYSILFFDDYIINRVNPIKK
jgi:uncharacterized protein with ParB-like and HNH nuclease domain